MTNLAKFHDLDEVLLTAWRGGGIEAGLEVLYEAIAQYDNLMTTITNVFQGGPFGRGRETSCVGSSPFVLLFH